MALVRLPRADRSLESLTLAPSRGWPKQREGAWSRVAFSAAHVVHDALAEQDPWTDAPIDWDATLAYRHHLWRLGFAVAEAMDTAQRGMGLGWTDALELIRRVTVEARGVPGAVVFSGAGTEQLEPAAARGVDDVIAAYEEQLGAIEGMGGRIILMASRALARVARGPGDYASVYGRLLSQMREPIVLHWLGEMFDPSLRGYWGNDDHDAAMEVCLSIIRDHAEKVDGIKISLLSAEKERRMRGRLPPGVKMYTGDDFNYPELIAGDDPDHGQGEHERSHALLGIFDAIAPAASVALSALAAGDRARYDAVLAPTVPLSRHIFKAPTRYYKTGVVFLAWLNGHQERFTMLGGQESARSLLHLAELVRLADAAGVLDDPDRAAHRWGRLAALHGLE